MTSTADHTYLEIAAGVATLESHDPRTKVGSVLLCSRGKIIAKAANRLPKPIDPATASARLLAPAKYLWIEHAERRTIYAAARLGIATEGATLYVHGGFPCADCARAIIESGVIRLVYNVGSSQTDHWHEHYEVSRILFAETGVIVVECDSDPN